MTELRKHFPIGGSMFGRKKEVVYALDGVTFTVEHGECLGVVGESGCGKTTLSRCILGLEEPTDGKIRYRGVDLSELKRGEKKRFHSKMQVVFQDPYASLNPRWLVRDIIAEPLVVAGGRTRSEVRESVTRLLEAVGLEEDHMYRFPHEFSGGQRQRIAIARALSVSPEFVVLDEPTSSLDVSVQAQILNLLVELQEKLDLTYMFITHNLNVIRHMATRVAVMYLGRVVELGRTEDVFENPLHPYTRALLNSIPVPNPQVARKKNPIIGDIPNPSSPPAGCHFNPRCQFAVEKCRETYPSLLEYTSGHFAACHLTDQLPSAVPREGISA